MGEFAARLKKLRLEEHLTQEELATQLGISRSTLGMYETGKREPDFETLEVIADFFNANMNYLTGYSDDSRNWEQIANDLGICPPNDFEGDPKDWYDMKINADKDYQQDTEPTEEHYYLNDETRQIAQDIFNNPNLRSLFSAARGVSPEQLKSQIDYLNFLKAKEKNESDEGC